MEFTFCLTYIKSDAYKVRSYLKPAVLCFQLPVENYSTAVFDFWTMDFICAYEPQLKLGPIGLF